MFKNFFTKLGAEDRKHHRLPTDFILKYKIHQSQEDLKFGQCKNISLGGIFVVEVDEHLAPNTLLDLELSLPPTFAEGKNHFNLSSVVMHCTKSADKENFNCGLKFMEKDKQGLKILEKYLHYLKKH
ncbi:PilZ domain-containing protein [Candidatus Auribacterota bacterium]